MNNLMYAVSAVNSMDSVADKINELYDMLWGWFLGLSAVIVAILVIPKIVKLAKSGDDEAELAKAKKGLITVIVAVVLLFVILWALPALIGTLAAM